MILSLVTAIFIAAAMFMYLSETPFAYYTLMVFVVAPMTVFVREYYLHGPAGTTSPVTYSFIAFILIALLLGGGAGASIRAFAARPSAQSE